MLSIDNSAVLTEGSGMNSLSQNPMSQYIREVTAKLMSDTSYGIEVELWKWKCYKNEDGLKQPQYRPH